MVLLAAVPEPGNIDGFIIGGGNAPASGISYQVTFRTIMTNHWCGGSIINSKLKVRSEWPEIIFVTLARWVLSAAHCLDQRAASSITVMAGSNFLNSGGVFHQAQSIRVHPSYNRVTFANDVGILQVTTPFQWTARVQPVVLGSAFTGGGVSVTFTG